MLYNLPQSFNKTNFYRIRTVSHVSAKTMILEKEEILRSELLNSRCEDNNFCRTTGQKAETIFNELEFFSEFNYLYVDIAHDILEGIAQAEIKLFLKEVVEKKSDKNRRFKRTHYEIQLRNN